MRERDGERRAGMPIMCRLCGKQEESVFHIIAACSYLSSNLYLHARHNPVAKDLYDELVHQLRQNENRSESKREPQTVTRIKNTEIWWDKKVMTQKKIKHDRPDIIMWDKENKHCKIVDVSIPLDTNVKLRERMKRDYYIELIDQLQRIYPTYKYAVILVIIGALGTVPKTLKENLLQIGINKEETGDLVETMQKKSAIGNTESCQELPETVNEL